ncbi:MAG: beta-propeller fold lactonase family protein [Nitrospira sp.]|nr:beta-propeller fold lactonase family protein [Nitrospira sp.]
MKRLHPAWFLPCLFLASGCGDGGGGGGLLGAIGGGGGEERTAGSIVYVTNSGANSVSGYTVNPSTGGLAAISGSPFSNIPTPSAIAVSANGLFVYIASSDKNTVTAFRVGTNGALLFGDSTSGNPNPVSVGTTPRALAISKDSQFLYVANSGSSDVSVFKIGTAGGLTLVAQTEGRSKPVGAGVSSPIALAITPNGRFLYVANSTSNTITAFQVDSSGLLTLVPQAGPSTNPISSSGTGLTALALSSNGQFLYVTNGTSNNVAMFRVEPSGLLTLIPPTTSNPISTGGTTPNGLAVGADGAHLYIANGDGGGTVATFLIGSNGLLTLVPAVGVSPNPVPSPAGGLTPVALATSPDGQFLYVANRVASISGGSVSAYTIVSESGTLVPVTQLLGNPFPAQSNPSAIATRAPAP